ncbi:Ubiquitin domain-containing protein UBFD1 [Lonchura striata]|uniref:Ubiquitin domain-containing protein UBFD1 n=1 Tax=Lonchura striata TaxID=40157 RepID=A0A218UAU4_9PASE|nr:Ubiquitin domain-containing protein UBFD1 [Lonchura striata domestica]
MAAAAAADGAEEPGMEAEAQELPLGCGGAGGSPAAGRAPQGEERREPPRAAVSNGGGEDGGRELVELKVIWNKNKYDVKFCLDGTGAELKQKIHSLTGLPPAMQKVMFKGLLPEEKTLREIKVTNGAKIMVVGSTINDVLAVNTPKEAAQQEVKAEENKKEPLCRQKQHRKVLDKGKPDDVMPSVKGVQERLPTVPLSGMYNKSGGKVRLTFKLEQDQLWIGTKERTEKLPMGSIKNVVSEPIEGHEDYHMMVSISAGPNRSILLLGLLGPNSVCRCNQRHGAGEVAVFLKARSPLAQENDTNLRTLLGEASNIPGCDSPGTYY